MTDLSDFIRIEHKPLVADLRATIRRLDARVRELEADLLTAATQNTALSDEITRLQGALERALTIAEGLFGMISDETWRDSGGDDGQGHYEGLYRAEAIRDELKRHRAALADPAEWLGGEPLAPDPRLAKRLTTDGTVEWPDGDEVGQPTC